MLRHNNSLNNFNTNHSSAMAHQPKDEVRKRKVEARN